MRNQLDTLEEAAAEQGDLQSALEQSEIQVELLAKKLEKKGKDTLKDERNGFPMLAYY